MAIRPRRYAAMPLAVTIGTVSPDAGQLSGFVSVLPAWFADTVLMALSGSAPNQYYTKDHYARVRVLLDGSITSLTVEAVPVAVPGDSVQDKHLVGVWVTSDPAGLTGWTYNQTITYSGSFDVKERQTITIPAGTRCVDVTENAFVTGIGAASFSVAPVPASVGKRCVIYGDSIADGFFASPILFGFAQRLRYSGVFDAVSYLTVPGSFIGVDTGGFTTYTAITAAIVARMADGVARTVYMQKGTNDYSTGGANAAAFGAGYGALIDAIHTADPGAKIFAQKMFHRAGEGVSGNGSTLLQFNNAIGTAVAAGGRSAFTTAINGFDANNTSSDLQGDGVHPNGQGHNVDYHWARGQLGQVQAPASATAVAAIAVTYVPAATTMKSQIRAGIGITSGGSPTRATAIADSGSLGGTWVERNAASGPEPSTDNGHAALKFDPSIVPEALLATGTGNKWKFLHASGFTGVWRVKMTSAADSEVLDNGGFVGTLTGISLIMLANRSIHLQISNGAAAVIDLSTSASSLPAIGTTFTLDIRCTQSGGAIIRVNKSVIGTQAASGTFSTGDAFQIPTLGAYPTGANGASMLLFEHQLHEPVSAGVALDDTALNAIVDSLAATWP